MLSRNSFLFKGFIRQSIWKPLSPFGKRTVLNENVLQLIKNGNIISNQKNITGINLMMKGELRCTSRLSNILSPNSIIDSNDEKLVEKQEEAVVEKNQSVSDIIESIPIKRNFLGDILPESNISATSKLSTQQASLTVINSKKTLRYLDFEIVDHFKYNGEQTKTLIIPISKDCLDEEIWCHTFHFSQWKNKFICNQRHKGGKRASAIISDGEEIIELSNYEFVGEPVLYKEAIGKLNRLQKLEYEIIEKPYFEIQENGSKYNKPLLRVFTNMNQIFGYEFVYYAKWDMHYCNTCLNQHKTCVSAKLIIQNDGTKFVRMRKHVCEPIDLTEIIVKEPDFVKLKNGQIFIFSSKEAKMGYKYYWDNKRSVYLCSECSPIRITAEPLPDVKNTEYLKLSKSEHICKPIQYQCDLSEIEQPNLEWPKINESECQNFITTIQENHLKYTRFAWTYVITSAPPESTPERKASCILYVGYTEDCGTRMSKHINDDGVVSQLLKIYQTLYMIPILNDIPLACHDLEALIYQLWKCGSLKIQLRNKNTCSWKSNGDEGSLQFISKNPDDPRHSDLVLGVKKFLITEIAKVHPDDMIILTSDKKSESTS